MWLARVRFPWHPNITLTTGTRSDRGPNPTTFEYTMSEYGIDVFGRFNTTEIQAIVDQRGKHWFTEQVIADALEIDRTSVLRLRENHAAEFSEGDDYTSLVFQGKRRTVYSEEGFLTICDMSSSEVAFRLRKWMRQHFRVRREGDFSLLASAVGFLLQAVHTTPQSSSQRPIVFTAAGVAEFISQIDAKFRTGQSFTIVANDTANTHGMKGQRHAQKR